MAIALVQQASGNSASVSFPGATTPGNFLVCVLTHRADIISTGPTSTHGTWSLVAFRNHATDDIVVEIWMRPNLSGTSTSVSFPGLNERRATIAEFSGMAHGSAGLGSEVFDQQASNEGSSTSPSTGTTAGTVKNNELWIGGMVASQGAATYSAFVPPGSLLNQGDTGGGANDSTAAAFFFIQVATGPAAFSATLSVSDTWVGAVATFRGLDIENITVPSIPAVSTMTASMLALDRGTATIPAVSAMTATIHRLRDIAATIPAVSTMTGTMTLQRRLTGTINAFADLIGTMDAMSSELVILSVSTPEVEAQPGLGVTLFGTFPIGQPVRVFVGPTGTDIDPPAYPAVPGNGYIFFPTKADRLTIYLPRLPPGVYRIFAESLGDTFTLLNALTVRPKQFRSSVFGMRNTLPPKWRTGPRSLDNEP